MNENVRLDIGNVIGGTHPQNAGPTAGNHSKVAYPGSAPMPGLHSLLGLHNMAYSPGWENQQFEPSSVQQMAVCLTTGNDGNKSPGVTLGYSCAFNNPAALGGGVDLTNAQTAPGVALPGYPEPHLDQSFQPVPYAANRPIPHQRDQTLVLWPNETQPVTSSLKYMKNWYGEEFHNVAQKWQKHNHVPTAKSPSSAVLPVNPRGLLPGQQIA